jgi:hypothetical protein
MSIQNGIFRQELECILTEKEKQTYSGELARLTQEQAELEDRKKEISASYKARIDACISQTRVIARKVSSGKEMRETEVRWNYDYLANCKCLFRLDTGELLDTKALTEDERQMCLKLEEQQEQDDICPKCEGDGMYYEDEPAEGEEGGEVYCDCPAGVARREQEAEAGGDDEQPTV